MRLQIDLAIDSMGQADSPDITLACISSLRRRGVLVLVGSMTCPLPINHGELACLPPNFIFLLGCCTATHLGTYRNAPYLCSEQLLSHNPMALSHDLSKAIYNCCHSIYRGRHVIIRWRR